MLALSFLLGLFAGLVINWLLEDIDTFKDVCRRERFTPVSLHLEGITMAKVGVAQAFTVVAKNAAGKVVPDSPITVTTDNGAVTCDPDGANGVLIAATAGTAKITATDGKLTATLDVTVDAVEDTTPATLEIVLA